VSQGFDQGGPPRHHLTRLAIGAAAIVVVLLVGLTVWLAKGRTQEIDDPVVAPRSTTSLSESAFPSKPRPTNESGDAAILSACAPIKQTFPFPDRTCRIAVPPDLSGDKKGPVVILLHGFNTSSETEASIGGWRQTALRDSFTLVLPEGQGASWNAGGCCAYAQRAHIDDIGYLTAVLDQVTKLPTTDPSRIYVVGESNGGMMAYAFGCAHADRIAAIVSVEGTPVTSCRPPRPIPVLHVHGRADQTVPYNGGQSLIALLLGVQFPSAPGAVGRVAQAMGCGAPSADVVAGKVTTRDWTNCGGGSHVRLVSIDGMGHHWPGGEPFDATSEIESFLGLRH
jgi:polyhydroxybutyrate depolymerase